MHSNHTFSAKHPDDILDYRFDWAGERNNTGLTDWLELSETIVSHEVEVEAGLTLVSSSAVDNNTAVLAWISGGTDGNNYTVTCKITTATRIVTRTALLPVKTNI